MSELSMDMEGPMLVAAPSSSVLRLVTPTCFAAFLFPALAGLCFGYDIGSTSGALQSFAINDSRATTSTLLSAVLHSASLFGALLGTFLTLAFAAALGRRREVMLGSVLYTFGSAICILNLGSKDITLALLLAGRVIYGVGIAFSMHAAPVYISEVMPAEVRGLFVSLKEGMIVTGIMMGFGAGVIFTNSAAWQYIWGIPIVIAIPIFIGTTFLPPSPRWLVQRAQEKAQRDGTAIDTAPAIEALARFRSTSTQESVEREVNEIVMLLEEAAGAGTQSTWGDLFKAKRALVAGLGLVLLQQVTGQPSVLYYQNDILLQAGFGDNSALAALGVSFAKLIATLCTVVTVDKFGRRPLLFVGITMMFVALVVLVIGFQLAEQSADPSKVVLTGPWPVIVLSALVLYVAGYQVGFGPIAWLLISEVFPLNSRTAALSLAVVVNFGFNLLATLTLAPLQSAFDSIQPGRGASYLFMIYAAFCLVSLYFVKTCVPETKGKTLEQIERELGGGADAKLPVVA